MSARLNDGGDGRIASGVGSYGFERAHSLMPERWLRYTQFRSGAINGTKKLQRNRYRCARCVRRLASLVFFSLPLRLPIFRSISAVPATEHEQMAARLNGRGRFSLLLLRLLPK